MCDQIRADFFHFECFVHWSHLRMRDTQLDAKEKRKCAEHEPV